MTDHADWRADRLNESAEFRRRIEDLRREVHRPRRAMRTVASMPFVDVLGLRGEEPSAYERECDEAVLAGGEWPAEGIGAPPVRAQNALERIRGAEQDLGLWLGATSAAVLVHEIARGTGPFEIRAVGSFGTPAPSGAIASTAAAHLNRDASYGKKSARSQALSDLTRALDPSIDACEVFRVDFR